MPLRLDANAPLLPPGDPLALGATAQADGVNFAVWAPEAEAVWLCLFDAEGRHETRWRLGPPTDGVWHGRLTGARPGQRYGWRAAGPWDPARGLRFNPRRLLLDPYARHILGTYRGDTARHLGHDPAQPLAPHPQDNADVALQAVVPEPDGPPAARGPRIPAGQRVVAEVHVRTLTARHPAVPPELRGRYAALAHPALIAHWRRLGVTTLQLMPLAWRLDEARLQTLGLSNHWGYNPLGFLAAEPRLACGTSATSPDTELREAVAALHAAGFEVWTDVVFNHTAETDADGPTISFRGLANRHWYRLEPADRARYVNWAGCGNVLNLAEPMVLRFVMDALRHWVLHFGFDGFRFDLASTLGRDAAGHFQSGGAFFAALQACPVLRTVTWVAEPWDLGPGGYRAGEFPTGWLEWNDRCRDALRAYWLRPGDARASRAELAQRLAGSNERYGQDPRRPRPPQASLNFVTAHDGYTLRDLVSYNERHNLANGERNRDGHHDNLSWNAGHEGESDDPGVRLTRARLQRALLATLLLARGTPMLLAGDEIGHSQRGNNNAYCQDNALTWLDWPGADPQLPAFVARLLALRRADPALHGDQWLHGRPGPDGLPDVTWTLPDGQDISLEAWHDRHSRGLRVHFAPAAAGHETVLLFNPAACELPAELPPVQRGAAWWCRLDSDRADGAPADPSACAPGPLQLPPRSVQVWCSQPPP